MHRFELGNRVGQLRTLLRHSSRNTTRNSISMIGAVPCGVREVVGLEKLERRHTDDPTKHERDKLGALYGELWQAEQLRRRN